MEKLKHLEIKKLLKELDYVESDFEYKSEIIMDGDSKFMKDVNDFLSKHPKLKEIFDNKINDKIDAIIKENTKEENDNTDLIKLDGSSNIPTEEEENTQGAEIPEEEENNEYTSNDKSPKLKKLYREIVKITHPDKVQDKKLNELYIKSTEMYEGNDLAGIYSICSELKIEYEINEDDANNILGKIKTLKDRIGFVESTFTWKWHFSKSQQEKDQLILIYVKMQLQ